jgi:Domain of unknown function (DUF4160)
MGKILILAQYIFLVYGIDINERRKHIHCTYAHRGYKRSCKFWLEPNVELDDFKTGGFSAQELKEIQKIIVANKDIILCQLDLFYAGEQVKAIRR